MPIIFTTKNDEGYFISQFIGKLPEDYVLETWKKYLEGDQWRPGLNELADISQADMSQFPKELLPKLAKLISHYYRQHSSAPSRLAIFAPRKILYGMSRVYMAWADESSQAIRLFTDLEEARKWVKGEQYDPEETKDKG